MGHDHSHDDHQDDSHPLDDVKPKNYWEHTPSRRAVPQFDVAKLAGKYLDDMEKGGRLHHQRKRS